MKLGYTWVKFWSSVDLTGNQTLVEDDVLDVEFWSSVDLTGNQTWASKIVMFG